TLTLVDIPGHEKIRYQSLEKYKANARAFVFVLDSGKIQMELKDVAEFLYNVLTDPRISRSGNRILIACNKQDSSAAKGFSVVRNLLEKEL
ncbi:Signal recognition particle receptor subunit beta, partial [Fasciolopsis buskii]